MQTFLPYPDFEQSAQCLDYRRLGKQRVEVLQLLKALVAGEGTWVVLDKDHKIKRVTPWYNHPACKMWRGYERALCEYGMIITKEWIDRGYKDTCMDKLVKIFDSLDHSYFAESNSKLVTPPWFGNKDFHAAHRSNLLRKDPDWYGQFGWTEPDDLPYIWPVV